MKKNQFNTELMRPKKIKNEKFTVFTKKNTDNSKTPLGIFDFFCICVANHVTDALVKKFWAPIMFIFLLSFMQP